MCSLDVGAKVNTLDVNINPSIEPRVFAFNHGRAVFYGQVGHGRKRYLLPRWCDHRQLLQFLQRVTISPRITQVDRVPLPAFHGLRDVHSSDRHSHNILDIVNVQAIACSLVTHDIHRYIAATGYPFSICRSRAGNRLEYFFNILANLLDDAKVRACDLDPDRGFDPGGQHIDSGLDRPHPRIREAWNLQSLIKFPFDVINTHTFTPLRLGLELNNCFYHGQGRWVRCRVRPADLAEHGLHFRNGTNQLVRLLQQFLCLAD